MFQSVALLSKLSLTLLRLRLLRSLHSHAFLISTYLQKSIGVQLSGYRVGTTLINMHETCKPLCWKVTAAHCGALDQGEGRFTHFIRISSKTLVLKGQ